MNKLNYIVEVNHTFGRRIEGTLSFAAIKCCRTYYFVNSLRHIKLLKQSYYTRETNFLQAPSNCSTPTTRLCESSLPIINRSH